MERIARYVLRAEPRAVPEGLQFGAGASVVLAATIVAAAVPASAGFWRAAPVAVAVFVFALFPVGPRPVAAVAVLGYLLVAGFLVNRLGELSWHGRADDGRLALFGACAAAGALAGTLRRRLRRPSLTVTVYGTSSAARRSGRCIRMREDISNG